MSIESQNRSFDWNIFEKTQQREVYANLEKRNINIGHEITELRGKFLEGRGRIMSFVFDKILQPLGIGQEAKQIKELTVEQHKITKLLKTVPEELTWSPHLTQIKGLDQMIKTTDEEIKKLHEQGVGLNRALSPILPSAKDEKDIKKLNILEAKLDALQLIKSVSDKVATRVAGNWEKASPSPTLQNRVSASNESDALTTRLERAKSRILEMVEAHSLDLDSGVNITKEKIESLQKGLMAAKKQPSEENVKALEDALLLYNSDDESLASFEEDIESSEVDENLSVQPSREDPIQDLLDKIMITTARYSALKGKVNEENSETRTLLKEKEEGLQKLLILITQKKEELTPARFQELSKFIENQRRESAEALEARVMQQVASGKRSELLEQEITKATSFALRAPEDAESVNDRIVHIGQSIAKSILKETDLKDRTAKTESLLQSALYLAKQGNMIAAWTLYTALKELKPQEEGFKELQAFFKEHQKAELEQSPFIPAFIAIKQNSLLRTPLSTEESFLGYSGRMFNLS